MPVSVDMETLRRLRVIRSRTTAQRRVVPGVMPRLARSLFAVAAVLTYAIGSDGLPSAAAGTTATAPPVMLGSPVSLTVAVFRPSARGQVASSSPVRSFTVHSAKSIREVAALLRAARLVEPPYPGCPKDVGSRDTLRFGYKNGDRWTVILHVSGCGFVNFSGGRPHWASPALVASVGRLGG